MKEGKSAVWTKLKKEELNALSMIKLHESLLLPGKGQWFDGSGGNQIRLATAEFEILTW